MGYSPSLLAKQFPVATRVVGIAFSYAVSVTVFGGFAPFIAAWLIAQTGAPLSPSFYRKRCVSSTLIIAPFL